MPKKDRLPYELRSDAASHIPKEDWDNMTKEQQDEYLRPFHHPKAYDGIKDGEGDSPRGIIHSERVKYKSRG